jgi:hypothetical protein
MPRDALLKSAAMDDEFFTHLRFLQLEDAELISSLQSHGNGENEYWCDNPTARGEWIKEYKEQEYAGNEFYFIIRHQMKDYGAVRMHNIKDKKFSLKDWAVSSEIPNGLLTYFAFSIYEMAFEILDLERACFDIRVDDEKLIDFHLRAGAHETERSDTAQYFIFDKPDWPTFKNASVPQMKMHRIFHG